MEKRRRWCSRHLRRRFPKFFAMHMHIHPVVVPLRISLKKIGEANIICARRRPKYVGGQRAIYDESLL
ncbi:MAG: DUF436 family protein [Oribacterium sp.]|nr:DUF436 family protein [Oribacterium sp.]